MLVRKSFHFRLRPTKKQAKALEAQLNECRWLYNELLEQRKIAYEELNGSLSKYQQSMFLPLLKTERESLAGVHSQVLQNVVDRLDKAFQAFFRRCKAGEKPGFPRFRGVHRYNSFCYPQSGFSLVGQEVKLSKLGSIRVKMHRPISNQRKNFCHKASKKIVEQYQYICLEDLDIKKMMEGSYFAKSITDASWNQFRQFLTYKAAEAGRKLGLVNPAYTTQDCYQCGYREEKKLSERMHCCFQCGYKATRDLNAAQNILALGLDGLGAIPRSLRL